jgi:hypothetical protein
MLRVHDGIVALENQNTLGRQWVYNLKETHARVWSWLRCQEGLAQSILQSKDMQLKMLL